MDGSKDTIYSKYVKRFLDFAISLVAIIVLSPVLAITAFLVKIKLGSPVVFKQARPGKNEEIFYLYKFPKISIKRSPVYDNIQGMIMDFCNDYCCICI